jgi:hypothetical protein
MPVNKTRTISDVQFPLAPQSWKDEELNFYRNLKNYIDRGFNNLQLPDYQKGVRQLLSADTDGLKWLSASNAVVNTKFYPIVVWWQKIDYLDYWIKQRGINIFMWDDRIGSVAGDLDTMHASIETYRQAGYDVSVIRHPGSYWVPDPHTAAFDLDCYRKGHIYAFNYPDEWEDKIVGGGGGDVTFSPATLYAAFASRMTDYDNWVISMGLTPGKIKYFINFNGTHVNGTTISIYVNMVNAGVRPLDIIGSDSYPCDNQQTQTLGGAKLYPSITGEMTNALTYFKAHMPSTVKVWYFLECCNQAQHVAGSAGWTAGWTFDGSRAPTSTELSTAVAYADGQGADGIMWFPQSGGGTTTDATDPNLIPIMLDIANKHNGSRTQGTTTSGGTIIINEFINGGGFDGGSLGTVLALGQFTFGALVSAFNVSATSVTSTCLIFLTIAAPSSAGPSQTPAGTLLVWTVTPGTGFQVVYKDSTGSTLSNCTFVVNYLVIEP